MGCTHSKAQQDMRMTESVQPRVVSGNEAVSSNKPKYPQYPKVSAPRLNSKGELVPAYDAGPRKGYVI